MGRKIRRVPPNWEHPKNARGEYIPMYDHDFETVADEWEAEYEKWKNKTHPDYREKYRYWEWNSPPDPDTCRPKFTEEPIWYQVYETVSEGSPVTPPFATKEELVDYLVEFGDFWDQKRGDGGWKRKNAENFVKNGWAPSLMVVNSATETIIHAPRDGDIERGAA